MKLSGKSIYDKFDYRRVPFLTKDEDSERVYNGHMEVTDAVDYLHGIRTGEEDVRLLDYLVYRPLPKRIKDLGILPNVHPQSYELQLYYRKLNKALKEGVTVGKEYFNPFFVLWLTIFLFEIPLYDKKGNMLNGSEINHPVYSNIDRYIMDIMWKGYKQRKYVAFMSGRGVGKFLQSCINIPTPSGDRKYGDLKVGDEIFTRTGEITKVKAVKEYGALDVYTMTLKDGRTAKCSTGHLWDVYSIYPKDSLATREAIEIAENIKGFGGKGSRYFLPIAGAVDFPEAEQSVDPYIIGYMLGNGSYKTYGTRIATDDQEVVDYFEKALGDDFGLTPDPTNNNYYIKAYNKVQTDLNKGGCTKYNNPFDLKIKALGMWGKGAHDKSIVDTYKYASKHQRMELLRGLMDSDGHAYKKRANAEYYSVSKDLINDVAWLVRSLGIKCKIGEDVRGGELKGYRLYIYTGKPIFKLERKLKDLKSDSEVTEQILRFRYRTAIVSMELSTNETEVGRCIEVEHESGLFLANDFIVTHNSFITCAIEEWYYLLFDAQELIVSATSEPIVEEAWSKFTETIDLVEKEYPGFRQKRITNSNIKLLAGEEYYDENNDLSKRGSLNEARRITYGDNANKTRGRRPHFQHIEEFASFPSHPGKGSLKNVLGQSKGSWIIMGSFKKAFVVMTGTGGSVDNKDAEDVFTNPKGFNLLEINEWGRPTSLFIPSFLKYGGTWESTGVPNIELAMRLISESRKALENDPVAYTQELQEFPISLEEVFLIRGTNIFNQDKLLEQETKLKVATEKPWKEGRLDYVMDNDGNVIGVEFVPLPGGKIIVVEEPQFGPEGKPLNGLYVAGVDSIDQGRKDSLVEGSKLAMTVKKRISNNMFSATSNLYVCFYNERSDDVRWDYENVLKISMWYNARINVEYTKINIVSFFRSKKQFWRLLKRPSIAIGSNVSGVKASTLIGSPATTSVIDHQDQKLADYIDDYYFQILYLPAVQQLQEYSREARTKFDFVVAMGLTELADEDMMGKPASEGGSASEDMTDFGMYRDKNGRKRWGTVPEEQKEIRSIALEEAEGSEDQGFQWVEAQAIHPFPVRGNGDD